MRLQKQYGDITLSEAIETQTKLRSGRPRKWHLKALCNLHDMVSDFMLSSGSKRITSACRAYARQHKLQLKLVEKRYAETMPRLRKQFPGTTDEELERHIRRIAWDPFVDDETGISPLLHSPKGRD